MRHTTGPELKYESVVRGSERRGAARASRDERLELAYIIIYSWVGIEDL